MPEDVQGLKCLRRTPRRVAPYVLDRDFVLLFGLDPAQEAPGRSIIARGHADQNADTDRDDKREQRTPAGLPEIREVGAEAQVEITPTFSSARRRWVCGWVALGRSKKS